jgi:uncharacterized membrane protein
MDYLREYNHWFENRPSRSCHKNVTLLSKDGEVLESRQRHIAKTCTWRLIGTIDTMILAWIISGDPLTGLKIGFAEVVTKMLLYYVHERFWYKSNYGLSNRNKKEL